MKKYKVLISAIARLKSKEMREELYKVVEQASANDDDVSLEEYITLLNIINARRCRS